MQFLRRVIAVGAACFLLGGPSAGAQEVDKNRPKLSLKANPRLGRSGQRVVFTAELAGGANDYEEFYCPTIEWEWGDGTESEQTLDCEPYEAGKSEIRRRFTADHVFQGGEHRVTFRLKRRDKPIATVTVQLQMQQSARELAIDP